MIEVRSPAKLGRGASRLLCSHIVPHPTRRCTRCHDVMVMSGFMRSMRLISSSLVTDKVAKSYNGYNLFGSGQVRNSTDIFHHVLVTVQSLPILLMRLYITISPLVAFNGTITEMEISSGRKKAASNSLTTSEDGSTIHTI